MDNLFIDTNVAFDIISKDKEDALQYYTALNANLKYLITRNTKDFKYGGGEISVFTPAGFLNFYETQP